MAQLDMASRRQAGKPLLWLSSRYTPGVDGAAVASVVDLANKTWTGDATKQPLVKRGIATVRNALRFDGVNDCLYLAAQNWTAYPAVTVYAVTSSPGGTSVVLEGGIDLNNAGYPGAPGVYRRVNVVGDWEFAVRGDVGLNVRITTSAFTGYSVGASVLDFTQAAASEVTPYVNGSPAAATNPVVNENTGTFGNWVLNMGARNNGTTLPFGGDICELIVFAGAHSAATVAAISAEMRREWHF